MKKGVSLVLQSIIIFFYIILLGCALGENSSYRSKTYIDPLVMQGMEALNSRVASNGGDEVLLDLTNEAEYRFLINRLTHNNERTIPAWLKQQIESQKANIHSNRGGTPGEVPEGYGHSIIKLVVNDDNTVFATSYAGLLKKSEYIFLDVIIFDEYNNTLTEYTAREKYNTNNLICHAKGSLYANTSQQTSLSYITANSMLCYMSRDLNGDGLDELSEPVLMISYCDTKKELINTIYPSILKLDHPAVTNAGTATDEICTVCLQNNGADCDYVLNDYTGIYEKHLVLPFKGELIFPDMEILTVQTINGDKPDPYIKDSKGNIIRKINFVLALEDAGGIVKKIKPADTAFFWDNAKTIVQFDPETNVSKLTWDLNLDFGTRLFRSAEIPRLFVSLDVPVKIGQEVRRWASTYIISKGFYTDTPFDYRSFLTRMDLFPGNHTLEIQGIDYSSGTATMSASPSTIYDWEIDNIPPEAELINLPPSTTANKKAAITVGGLGVEKYSFKLDAVLDGKAIQGSWSPVRDIKYPIQYNTSTIEYETLEYTLQVCGIDKAGNKQIIPTEHRWEIVPSRSPEVFFVECPDYFSNSTSINIKAGGNGVFKFRYQLDDEPILEVDSFLQPVEKTDLTDGIHTVKVWGFDGETYLSTPAVHEWKIDTTPPQAVLYPFADKTLVVSPSNEIEIDVEGEDVFAYQYIIDDESSSDVRSSDMDILLSLDQRQVHAIQVYAIDRSGNKQEEATVQYWQINPDTDQILLKKLPYKQTCSTNISIQLDSKAGMRYRYKLDSEEWSKEIPLENLLEIPVMRFTP